MSTSSHSSPETELSLHADFEIGPGAAKAYERLSYKMWFALAEFVDNSTQSRINYGGNPHIPSEEWGE